MTRPRGLTPLLTLGAAAAALSPALALGSATADAPPTGSVVTSDFAFTDGASGSTTTTIAAGGSVSFSYPTGQAVHDVVFDAAQPTSCSGLPKAPAAAGWSGSCRFDKPGTYTLFCAQHAFMTGTVVVDRASATPTPTPTASASPRPTPTATPTPGGGDGGGSGSGSGGGAAPGGGSGAPAPGGGAAPSAPVSTSTPRSTAARSPRIARRQKGTRVRGSLIVARAGSTLTVQATLDGKRVGRYRKRLASSGRASFAVALSPHARTTLRRRHTLKLGLAITVKPATGATYRAKAKVTLKPS